MTKPDFEKRRENFARMMRALAARVVPLPSFGELVELRAARMRPKFGDWSDSVPRVYRQFPKKADEVARRPARRSEGERVEKPGLVSAVMLVVWVVVCWWICARWLN